MTPAEEYQAQTAALAAGTGAQVAAIFAAVQSGAIVTAGAAALIAAVINMANASATTLADAYVSTQVEILSGVPTPAIGVPPVDDADRLHAAAQTILDDADREAEELDLPEADKPVDNSGAAHTTEMRLVRLAESEPVATAQRVAVEVMDAQPEVIGWRRVLDADACNLCQFLWRGGRVYRTTTPFQRHPNCNCQPEPVLADKENIA